MKSYHGQAGSTVILAAQLSFVISVLREDFVFMFQTFSRNDPPEKKKMTIWVSYCLLCVWRACEGGQVWVHAGRTRPAGGSDIVRAVQVFVQPLDIVAMPA